MLEKVYVVPVERSVCCACGAVHIAQSVSLITDEITKFDVQVTVQRDIFV